MAKPAAERYEMTEHAYKHIVRFVDLTTEAGVLNGAMAKSVQDLVASLSSAMMILDPDKYTELAKQQVKEYEAKTGERQSGGFVGVDRPAGAMYATTEGWNKTPEGGYL